MAIKTIVVLGAGGMAREIEWLIRNINAVEDRYKFLGYVVSDLSQIGPNDSRDRLIGDYDWLLSNKARIDAVAVGVGTPAVRLKLASEASNILPDADWPTLVHPSAIIDSQTVLIGRGVQICAGVVCTVNISLEAYVLCNFGCTLGHEASVGEFSVVNPGANVSGGVSIGKAALIGTGAQVLQYLKVGNNAVVGAGAVVTRNVPEDRTVIGIPARILPPKSIPGVRHVDKK